MPPTFSCCLIGSESLLIRCGEMLRAGGHLIRMVGSDAPLISEWAAQHGIPHFDPGAGFDALRPVPFDYLFSIANLTVLPADAIALARFGAINFHDGPLPAYAGLNTPVWALLNGESTHGITWHRMEPRVDAGDILKERTLPIDGDDTALTLNAKCYEAAIESFGELVGELADGRVVPRRQAQHGRRYFSRRRRPDGAGVLAWDRDADAIAARVRALDFGGYPNPLSVAKAWHQGEVFMIAEAQVLPVPSDAVPGTVTRVVSDTIEVATATRNIAVRLRAMDGRALSKQDLVERFGGAERSCVSLPTGVALESLQAIHETTGVLERHWVRGFEDYQPVALIHSGSGPVDGRATVSRLAADIADDTVEAIVATFPGVAPEDVLLAAAAAFLSRMTGLDRFDIGWSHPELRDLVAGVEPFFSVSTPLKVECDPETSFRSFIPAQVGRAEANRRHLTFASDLALRYPALARQRETVARFAPAVALECWRDGGERCAPVGRDLTVAAVRGGRRCLWLYDPGRIGEADAVAMRDRFLAFLGEALRHPDLPIGEIEIVSTAERRQLLEDWNRTERAYPSDRCIHHLIEEQARRTPDRVALICGRRQWTYAELNRNADRLARWLQREGVVPETLVGVCFDRSAEMVVAVLAILKAGGAYLPLDPTYPGDRLRFMLEDSRAGLVLTREAVRDAVPDGSARTVCVDTLFAEAGDEGPPEVHRDAGPDNLAYVLYTSGSTGTPKGVMVEHRNVVNFFGGMDERIDHDPPGVWLAVTTLSFDISVLELLWTLTRGFTIVVYVGGDRVAAPGGPVRVAARSMEFSLFYFSSDESRSRSDKYRLLMESATFADRSGFVAVWTPERHFHAFGGLFPNPSVISAALAAVTTNVRLRAGSVVLPLHSPIRVAEEWALVDNLSNGRVDISFASGWHPNDFVLRPENFANARRLMRDHIETVRALWRGDVVRFPGPGGELVDVRTLPRPIQPELPVWLTAAGNPETFRVAGALGANVLTHLLGQGAEELAQKVRVYRTARREAGLDPGSGRVTLMLHTFVGDDLATVRETVRQPMKAYLRSAMHLVKQAAWSFPTFAQKFDGQDLDRAFDALRQEELDALLEFSFERYFETSGLFGTPSSCLRRVRDFQALGVDEVACLVDFGLSDEVVLDHLPHLRALRDEADRDHAARHRDGGIDESIPGLIDRHGVTHLQCTPSMVGMLAQDPDGRRALSTLKALFVGGEAMSEALAQQLTGVVAGTVMNMYGPTETTVWSATYDVREVDGRRIPIGRPIANTRLYVLDKLRRLVPACVPGELLIGGDSVARGYLNRPELTDERFIADPFTPGGRLYRTGDLVRYRSDGNLEFLGRLDHQVKVRGHRVELQEIETCLNDHPAVRQSLVMAVEDRSGDLRLAAYVVCRDGEETDLRHFRGYLRERLPEVMIPAYFVRLESFPETPSRKIDRRALPPPAEAAFAARDAAPDGPVDDGVAGAGRGELEQTVREIWRTALETPRVGRDDNFFDLGGHSLLAVRVQQMMKDTLGRDIKLTDLFTYPTIRTFVAYLSRSRSPSVPDVPAEVVRTRDRRELIAHRAGRRRQARRTASDIQGPACGPREGRA